MTPFAELLASPAMADAYSLAKVELQKLDEEVRLLRLAHQSLFGADCSKQVAA